jgi:hypothetical protein
VVLGLELEQRAHHSSLLVQPRVVAHFIIIRIPAKQTN